MGIGRLAPLLLVLGALAACASNPSPGSGAGAVVTGDVKDHALVVGVPAAQIGWMSRHGERLDLPLDGDGEARCPATGECYVLERGECRTAE